MSRSEQIKCCVDNTICKLSININRHTAMSQANWIPLDTRGTVCFLVLLPKLSPFERGLPNIIYSLLLQMSFFHNLFWTTPVSFLTHTSQISYHNLTTTFLSSPTDTSHFKYSIYQFTTRYPPDTHFMKIPVVPITQMILTLRYSVFILLCAAPSLVTRSAGVANRRTQKWWYVPPEVDCCI